MVEGHFCFLSLFLCVDRSTFRSISNPTSGVAPAADAIWDLLETQRGEGPGIELVPSHPTVDDTSPAGPLLDWSMNSRGN